MAEFIRTKEKVVNVGEPVIFENNTDSDFSVSAAIIFRKSGLYDVSIEGRKTIISKVAERKRGKWIRHGVKEGHLVEKYTCSECDYYFGTKTSNFCPNCGADMRQEGEERETD